ncbi:MAG: class I SAM-dependent methyltransferase [Lachnospiraceae bacterium]|nr:class I SAM-dependent methyltransferase [Lachnospiraceae bacterium]MBR4759123.1 class I SAM-dependent methyltransferase [Lachnospiraceae bacterium]
MWTADKWEDYEVLDTGCGEKLERWGSYILVRPDPQVIWDTEYEHPAWKKVNGHYHRSAKGGGYWDMKDLPEEWMISYGSPEKGMKFHLKPFAFKHTGVFPEQAVNWEWCAERIKDRSDKQLKVLNLFAYTGGATVSAALAGAFVTHVDAAKGMVGWAKENAASSLVPSDRIRWIVDDCRKFVEREIRRGNRYDGIIMDPPSYGRGPKGEIWKIEEAVFPFIKTAAQLLSEDAEFFLINSYTTGLQPAVLSYMLNKAITTQRGGCVEAGEVGLPVSGSTLVLPCGACGRWYKG